MSKMNFDEMSDKDLLTYIRTHPHDTEAFHKYMDRLNERPGVLCTTDEEFEAELRKRINKSQA
ncbi:hypothetical protein H6G80_08510 [Nostoc sp. FACHB-87]|uniref:DUF6887 family protein n=2 Tax=Nostocaceae TaxID=1162 RepID=UPI0016850A81|nr:hypothetical protein [Nostoc sp. FACHB-190]MBD2454120.1 hypothetical protein [Nostoc sp. FACHB-87]MBD2476185.1 hypothetical protein [Anabaena sp. FACHB-83]